MPRKTLPANLRLDVSLLRAITAMRVVLDDQLQNNPQMPTSLIELDDALETAENAYFEDKHPLFIVIKVKYHEADFTL